MREFGCSYCEAFAGFADGSKSKTHKSDLLYYSPKVSINILDLDGSKTVSSALQTFAFAKLSAAAALGSQFPCFFSLNAAKSASSSHAILLD